MFGEIDIHWEMRHKQEDLFIKLRKTKVFKFCFIAKQFKAIKMLIHIYLVDFVIHMEKKKKK